MFRRDYVTKSAGSPSGISAEGDGASNLVTRMARAISLAIFGARLVNVRSRTVPATSRGAGLFLSAVTGGVDRLEVVAKCWRNSSGSGDGRTRRAPRGRRSRLGSSLTILAALAIAMVAMSACGGAFKADTTVSITAPAALTTVKVPFTATWDSTAGPSIRYAVFLDKTPIPPGQTMRVLADTGCKRVPGCYPSPILLAGQGVYLTTQNHFQVQTLPTAVGLTGHENPPIHTLTIILFSGSGASTMGHRIGEGGGRWSSAGPTRWHPSVGCKHEDEDQSSRSIEVAGRDLDKGHHAVAIPRHGSHWYEVSAFETVTVCWPDALAQRYESASERQIRTEKFEPQ